MPSIAQIESFSSFLASPCLKKRKRIQWPFDDAEQHAKFIGMQYTSPLMDFHSMPNMNNLNPVTPSQSTVTNMASSSNDGGLVLKPPAMKTYKVPEIKRQRTAVPSTQQQDRDEGSSNFQFFTSPYKSYVEKPADPELAMDLSPTGCKSKIDLSPCHICHQKPRVKRDLDSYDYCEGCQKRTCYVCMRSCLGPYAENFLEPRPEGCKREVIDISSTNHGVPEVEGKVNTSDIGQNRSSAEIEGRDNMDLNVAEQAGEGMVRCYQHSERICSHCCVERGPDGEIWCLGCMRVEEAQLRRVSK